MAGGVYQGCSRRGWYDVGRYMASMKAEQHPLLAFLVTE
jgi:hypothetical protein